MEEPGYTGRRGTARISDTSEAIVESPSAQLLDFVLGRVPDPSPSLSASNNAQPHGPQDDANNLSADQHSKGSGDASFPPASASVAPASYHFHGLASTQSQTEVLLGSEGSQKENEHAYAQAQAVRPAPSTRNTRSRSQSSNTNSAQQQLASKSKRPLTPSRVLGVGGGGNEPLSPRASLPRPTKVVNVLSPTALQKDATKEPTTKASTMRYRRRPSPSFPSQDSFAGPTASQDPDLFIATSRQFDIPLDQLGRSASQDRSLLESRTGRTSVASSEPAGAKPPMDDYSLSSSSSAGKILVANSDSSGPSQDSQKIRFWSISQEPTQLNSDASDAAVSEHADEREAEVEADPADQVADASTRVEPTQAAVRTQEATQIVEDSTTAEVGQPEPSVVSDKLSHLSLSPPERRVRSLHHVVQDENVHTGPTPGTSNSGQSSGPSASGPPVVLDKRSLLNTIPPEKRARYMHHFQKNSVPVSEASRMATAGTSLGAKTGSTRAEETMSPTSPLPPVVEEVAQPDSEQQVEMDISPVKRTKSREQEVIPPSESDAADNSREEEEEEVEAGLEPMEMSPVRTPAASTKGKQRANPFTSGKSLREPASSGRIGNSPAGILGRSPAGTSAKSCTLASPIKISASSRSGDAAMGPPPPVPQQQERRQPHALTKGVPTPPVASTSAAALLRDQQPPTPSGSAARAAESEQDSPEIPLARIVGRRMEEEESEEENHDALVLEEEEDEKPPSRRAGQPSRKRKRRNPAVATKKASKSKTASARKVAARATSVAPPPSKKARTFLTVARKFGAGLGTQVFALFKTDSSYYGAEVYSLHGNRGHVKFFDGLEDSNLGVAQMRRFELRKDDIVIPGSKPYKAKVIDDSFWASENEVSVEYIEGPEEGLEFTVTADELRIPSRVIQSQWKDRMLEPSEIVPAVHKSLKDTPSPSKNSVVNTAPSRGARNKLLSKYGIIITQGPGNQNWSREKEKYINIVKDNGGSILSDWLDVFSLHGKHSNGNKRWTIQRSDVKYVPKDKLHSFDRVFLVSDVHNQKPKYLLALALGIPCVSVDWLDHVAAGEELPWSQFLLAAGHSEPLGAPISQMVDLDWGSTGEHLTEIMENSVPLKVLNGTSVLCVGSDLFPHPAKKSTTDADRSLEASRTVPRIILAMGAKRVEAVADAKHASSSQDLSQYDYVVVKEAGVPHAHPHARGAAYVDVNWIKECLIAGRLFPVPEWMNE